MSGGNTASEFEVICSDGYSRYCSQIDKEDGLIDRRVNWLLTSQSILFAALGLSDKPMAVVVLPVIPWVGFLSSLAIGITIWAASISFMQYRRKLEELCPPESDLEQHYPQLHRKRWNILSGLLPTSAVPLIFCIAWMAVHFR